jgi:hypothetical protein
MNVFEVAVLMIRGQLEKMLQSFAISIGSSFVGESMLVVACVFTEGMYRRTGGMAICKGFVEL